MEIHSIPLVVGQKYTLYGVSDGAMTSRQEIIVATVLDVPEFRPAYVGATRGKWRLGTFKIPRKRGDFHLDVSASGTLIVPGWDQIPADHDVHSSFAVSATLNLASEPEAIREMIERNINPNYSEHDRVIAYPHALDARLPNGGGILVFPDSPTEHAVIERMREELGRKGSA